MTDIVRAEPEVTGEQRARFLAYIEENPAASIREAAGHIGVKRYVVKAALHNDPDFKAAYQGARGNRRDALRTEIWTRAFDREDPSSGRLILKLAEAELPEFRPATKVELTTPAGQPLEIDDGRRPTSLADVIELARALGTGLGEGLRSGGTGGDVRAAEDVLPEAAVGERPTGALPAA